MTALVAAGCTAPNPGLGGVQPLDSAALVTAQGAKPDSQVGVHRQGPLQPEGADVTVAVRDSSLRLHTTEAGQVVIEELSIALADTDLPPSQQLPQGVKLRAQTLSSTGPLQAKVLLGEPDTLVVHASGSLIYHTAMELADGSLYPLGNSTATGQDLEIRIERDADGVRATLDAPPAAECGQVGDLLTLSRCSMFVEADANVRSYQ
jgi:hypothetical protein